jgi:hypothetical protein
LKKEAAQMKFVRIVLVLKLAALAAMVAYYRSLDVSKKRFIKHLAKQVPYLPARYFA